MPPRWLSLVIVGFWLTTTGWLLWQDLASRFRTDEPPPYVIDLVEEVRMENRFRPHATWKVFLNDGEVLQAQTWVQPAETGNNTTYEIKARLAAKYGRPDQAVTVGPMQLREVETTSEVTREGDLLSLRCEVKARVDKAVWLPVGPMDVVMFLTCEIHDGRLFPHVIVRHQEVEVFDKKLEPVKLPSHGAVLVPLHPVNRIQGLRPNQAWRIPLVDPLAGLLPGGSGGALEARVLPEAEMLTHKGHKVPCWVIQYEGESTSARTWVQQDSGLVLRQEVIQGGERWRMERELDHP
jgi:hypothetical protein